MVVTKPATERPRLPSVGRLGLIDPPAGQRLAQLGWYDHDDQAHVDLLWSLSRAPDPDAALRALVRLSENPDTGWDELKAALVTERGLRGRLFAVLGSSLALADHLAVHPQSWKLLRGKVTLPSRDRLREAFTECVDDVSPAPDSAVSRLRTLYRDQLLLLAALDVAATVEDEPVVPFTLVAAHLSDIADAALAAALRVAEMIVCGDRTPPRLAVIAMGKCGARELNYVSDVDVIFVAEQADTLSTRVAGEMMKVASEAFFQVDAGLRPEGRSGELVRTLDSHIAYYQRWAKTWEFQALLKARVAAGDAGLGERYLAALMPMVWVACEREDFVVEVQAMRRRVEQLLPADVRARELKLGTGGLRDVEFAVQLLQLVHGRSDASLHVASTVDALAALGQG
ncbi:MAG TPA: bifunctional [glutamine synthetase] adenylyltransferase/[glutamine synthetase]-adenylyl-L-tyrosine phosphorylase, partial [Mycobacterium sp.]|nr:bifunctional [glutamine synthetase] adenylyltransferase/[glutamine synthetase]-adenylyl-L-tyrosine phosphorylase [Mycobacterium sp.]